MKKNEQKPKIRFKGFTDAWEQRKLEGIYKFQYGEFNNNPSNGGIYPVYGANGIIGGYTNYNAENSVIIGHMGEYAGSVLWGNGKHFVTYNGTISKPRGENVVSKFGYYMLYQKDINKICGGSGLPFLSYEQLNKIEVCYPKDIKEQKSIANYLTNIDNLITLHQRKCDKLVNIKKSLLEKMFPKNGNNVPEIRFKGFTEAWEQRKLKDMSTYKNGTGHEDKQSSTGKYELINLNSVSIDGGLKSSGKYIDESDETLQIDDLVMVLSDVGHGDLLGRVAVIPENNRFVLNQRVALLRPNDSVFPRFLFTCINAGQAYFKINGAGSSQLNISKEVVENFEPFIPKKDEQIKISETFEKIDNLITLHQRKLEQLKNVKKSLIEKMFV